MGAWSPDFTNRRLAIGSGAKKWTKHVIISHFQKIMTDFGSRLVPELHSRAEGEHGDSETSMPVCAVPAPAHCAGSFTRGTAGHAGPKEPLAITSPQFCTTSGPKSPQKASPRPHPQPPSTSHSHPPRATPLPILNIRDHFSRLQHPLSQTTLSFSLHSLCWIDSSHRT